MLHCSCQKGRRQQQLRQAAAGAAAQQPAAAQEEAAVAAAGGAVNAAAPGAAAGDAVAGLGPGQAGADAAEQGEGAGGGSDGDESGDEDGAGEAAAAAGDAQLQLVPLMHALAQLPRLVSLKLKGVGTTVEAVEQITNMTRLTRLTISGLGFDDAALNSKACSLTGLRRLSLSDAEVTDAPLLVVLQQLTEVKLANCSGVTDRGVRWLARLPILQVVDVGSGSAVSAGAVAAALSRAQEA